MITTYTSRLATFQQQQQQLERQLTLLASLRLAFFLGMAFALYLYLAKGISLMLPISLLSLLAFLFFLFRFQKTKREKQKTEKLIALCQLELAQLQKGHLQVPDGKEYQDAKHRYTSDLDVFGSSSLFQLLNRTSSKSGSERLAELLKNPHDSSEKIEAYQQAVRELGPKVDFRQQYWAEGQLNTETAKERREIEEWLQEPPQFITSSLFTILRFTIPLLNTGLVILTIQSERLLFIGLALVISMLSMSVFFKHIQAFHAKVSRKKSQLDTYASLSRLIEKESFQSENLAHIVQELRDAQKAFQQLSTASSLFDQRLNILANMALNGLFLFDFQFIAYLEKWKNKHREQALGWIQHLAELEVYTSLATYHYNYPHYCFSKIHGENALVMENLSHPLILSETCVPNSLSFGNPDQFLLITGSNMSGKSTFLRSVGTSLILAQIGAPVPATRFETPIIRVMSSMRISDSLNDHVSYFYAELLRLQSIVEALDRGEYVFVLLDEILKGTNSEDKLEGSRRLIRKFLSYKGLGMIATHDLELGALEQETQERVRNYCFESTISQGELQFEYQLHRGVATNKNATFLLEKMKIV
ncbi:hypothetical protein QWY31_14970 [Cytophagales bacterium LB-30]|uniref:DNA mismatch repair proteins mutS family domain-containing protein n=1 Tax=Shiella aurantiaca TaxID=3058365 RepID=A0ABT8F8J9_9BACT|nr:hypothetical protein [Shiella aurantiaca]MDN4166812.1 hypothetical protein [Shiella aurantiaca]